MADLAIYGKDVPTALDSYLGGMKFRSDQESNAVQDQLRRAQAEEILQKTAESRQAFPMEQEKRRLANITAQGNIDTADLERKAKANASFIDALSTSATMLQNVPSVARHAALRDSIQQAGVDPNRPDVKSFLDGFSKVSGDQLPTVLGKVRDDAIMKGEKYQTELMKQREHYKTSTEVARIGAASRENVAASRGAKVAATIDQQAAAGKLNYEKAAVAYNTLAMSEEDPVKAKQFQDKAAQYEQLAAKLRAAGGIGKVDVGAATNLPTTEYTPVLVPGATPPATPNKPSLPQGWSVK